MQSPLKDVELKAEISASLWHENDDNAPNVCVIFKYYIAFMFGWNVAGAYLFTQPYYTKSHAAPQPFWITTLEKKTPHKCQYSRNPQPYLKRDSLIPATRVSIVACKKNIKEGKEIKRVMPYVCMRWSSNEDNSSEPTDTNIHSMYVYTQITEPSAEGRIYTPTRAHHTHANYIYRPLEHISHIPTTGAAASSACPFVRPCSSSLSHSSTHIVPGPRSTSPRVAPKHI